MEKKARCMITCVGKKRLSITVCVDRDTGEISKKVEESYNCTEKVYDQ